MRTDHSRAEADHSSTDGTSTRWARLVILALKVTAAAVALMVLPGWLLVVIPRWLIRGASIAFLGTLLAVYVVAVPAVLVGCVCSFLGVARARRRRDRAALRRSIRWALLASSCLAGLIAMELASATKLRWSQRLPDLPTRFATSPSPRSPAAGTNGAAVKNRENGATPDSGTRAWDDLSIVVVGESSARGEPYHPWLSVGQIVGWQLERIFPGRKIRVDVRAEGGFCLEQAVLMLSDLTRRPDAIIVFSGQNEFQTRFGWSRNVRHYVEEGPEHPLALIELARWASRTVKLILDTLDRYRGESPPPPRVTRELVDHPTCTPAEHAFLLEDFHRRLDALAAYCRRIGTFLILIVPGSNDGAYEPSRSVLAASTPPEKRAAFAREFQAVRMAEAEEPESSIAAYRRLLEQHPEFAESHYRLARLLVRTGAWQEARRHFILARELDGLILRCPADFREACRTVARRHDAVLIDGPELLARLSPHGILDDHLFHDAQHLNLVGTVALAQDMLEQLEHRRAFGWPETAPVPRVEPDECARHFELSAEKWSMVCSRSSDFYRRTAYVRFDPSERRQVAERYDRAARELAAGRPLPQSGLPSLDMAIIEPER